MNNTIQIFQNPEFGNIRTMRDEKGEPWFCGKDVAEALGYSNTKDALLRHVDKTDKLGSQITTSGQARTMTFINESGLYSLILSSKLESARRFKHWVTSEVLPSIRKQGGYMVLGAAFPFSPFTVIRLRSSFPFYSQFPFLSGEFYYICTA